MLLSGELDLTNDTLKVMLLDADYTPNADHDFVADIVADELSGTGYTGGFGGSGRKTVTSKVFTINDTNDRGEFDAGDITWTSINAGTVGCAVLIKEITDDSASILIAAYDVTNVATNGSDLTLVWNSVGLISGN